jgi:hypothetical protein
MPAWSHTRISGRCGAQVRASSAAIERDPVSRQWEFDNGVSAKAGESMNKDIEWK